MVLMGEVLIGAIASVHFEEDAEYDEEEQQAHAYEVPVLLASAAFEVLEDACVCLGVLCAK